MCGWCTSVRPYSFGVVQLGVGVHGVVGARWSEAGRQQQWRLARISKGGRRDGAAAALVQLGDSQEKLYVCSSYSCLCAVCSVSSCMCWELQWMSVQQQR